MDTKERGQVEYILSQTEWVWFCQSGYQEITAVLERIAPKCQSCNHAKLYFCLQDSCNSNALICRACDDMEYHLFHDKNELQLLFVEAVDMENAISKSPPTEGKESLCMNEAIISELKRIEDGMWGSHITRRSMQMDDEFETPKMQPVLRKAIEYFEEEKVRIHVPMCFVDQMRHIVKKALIILRNNKSFSTEEQRQCREAFAAACSRITIRVPDQSLYEFYELAKQYRSRLLPLMVIHDCSIASFLKRTSIGRMLNSKYVRMGIPLRQRAARLFVEQLVKHKYLPRKLTLRNQYYPQARILEKSREGEILKAAYIDELVLDTQLLKFELPNLKALTIQVETVGLYLPVNLRKLTIEIDEEYHMQTLLLLRLMPQISRLVALRELQIITSDSVQSKVWRALFRLALERNLLVLKVRIVTQYAYESPLIKKLNEHYRVYRRAMSIGTALMKRIGWSYWLGDIMDRLDLPADSAETKKSGRNKG